VYGETNLVYSGPVIRGIKAESDKVVLSFDHIGSGLVAADGKALRGFYISADGKTFVPGTAEIVDNTVIVTSSNVRTPVAVRYGAEVDMGKENLDVNLANQEGMPASPFTAGSVH
jgi:sialate O-acetylesterase